MSETQVKKKKKLAIIASKGSLDMAYPPLILATTALAMDYDVGIFFTFYGLDIIHKRKLKKLKVSAIGNPAAPVPVPSMIGMLPGMNKVATSMMKGWMNKANVEKLPDLVESAQEFGATLFGCQMTMDVMGVKREDLLDDITLCGAAGFLDYASDADITLFV